MPDELRHLPRRGGLIAGLRAGARGFWRACKIEARAKSPRVIRKLLWWWGLLAAAPILCLFVVLIYATTTKMVSMELWLPLSCTFLATSIAIQFTTQLKLRRMRAHAASLDYRICPECGYTLFELAAAGNCPECGTAYTPEQLAAIWTKR